MITKASIKANKELEEFAYDILSKEPYISRNKLLDKIREINGKASSSVTSRIYNKHRRLL